MLSKLRDLFNRSFWEIRSLLFHFLGSRDGTGLLKILINGVARNYESGLRYYQAMVSYLCTSGCKVAGGDTGFVWPLGVSVKVSVSVMVLEVVSVAVAVEW